MKINIFWIRRDLRVEDNRALSSALSEGLPVLPVFIFDDVITSDFPEDDPRINFIYGMLGSINYTLNKTGSSVLILKGEATAIWEKLSGQFEINAVYAAKDYEPYAIKRDSDINAILAGKGTTLHLIKDHVIFEENEIRNQSDQPYTVFTPYKKKWLKSLNLLSVNPSESKNRTEKDLFIQTIFPFPSLKELGFRESQIKVKPFDLSVISDYEKFRNFPAADLTTYLGPHLRFGTVSIRKIVTLASQESNAFLSELIWREFFMQILFNFPQVVTNNFRRKFDNIVWRNNEKEFSLWCKGETGYPIVDAGMRQLNETGYMHNRVRMVVAGFLCKHLLIDWRWGEAYFAGRLLDYELSSNNGNWQWAAGTGCDAAPYFRIFNPESQQKRFDPDYEYIRRWTSKSERSDKTPRIVEHDFARKRALEAYRQ